LIQFLPTSTDDLPQLTEWIALDPDHAGKMAAAWWMQGQILSCRVEDGMGPVMYLRIDREGMMARLHIQFGPVAKSRIARAFIDGIPRMKSMLVGSHYTAMIFESVSESLISFMGQMGFLCYEGNDYVMKLEVAV